MNRKNLVVLALALIVLSLAVITAYFSVQGSILPSPDNCEWTTVDHPNTGDQYSNIDTWKEQAMSLKGLNETEWERYRMTVDTRFQDVDSDGVEELQIKGKTCLSGVESASE